MLRILGRKWNCRNGFSRRDVLQVGTLGLAGLQLADVLRLQAQSAQPASKKSVIMIWLRGGPSHIDSYDMKPDAPLEVRGEFRPIDSKVPGIQLCEHIPLHSSMMDKLAIIRGVKSNDLGDHTPHYIITGSADRGKRPAFGSVVSRLRARSDGMPPYVSLMYKPPGLYDNEGPVYLGAAHRPFAPKEVGLANLSLSRGVTLERLGERRELLRTFDTIRGKAEQTAISADSDIYARQALEMIASPKVRDAFNVSQETPAIYERYGKFCESFLVARRLAEAGVSVITLKVGDWDTHEKNFRDMREQLPQLDRGFFALVSDLHERGLERDVAVVMWGEFGRAPRISRGDGRDHWPEAGAAVLAGGGFKVGQVIGETDSHGGRSKASPYTPSNILANLYLHLGVDPTTTLRDLNNRPMPLLDDARCVRELVHG